MEKAIDKVVAELYGIADEELEEVKKTFGVLKGEMLKVRMKSFCRKQKRLNKKEDLC